MKKEYDFLTGEVLAFDKPLTWTSFNLVKVVRNNLSRRLGVKRLKVGHAGTLDPLATGVMIVCTGRCTKLIDQLQAGTKEYVATLRLGATTPSFDAEHEVDAHYPTSHITRQLVDEKLKCFLGSIMQVPPVYSACKVEGRRAFDYARQGDEVKLEAKELVIDEIELLDCHLPEQGIISPDAAEVAGMAHQGVNIKEFGRKKQRIEDLGIAPRGLDENAEVRAEIERRDPSEIVQGNEAEDVPYIKIRVVCSKGTYIRALARDIGEALGSGAYLIGLRRTRVGDIRIEDCLPVDNVEEWVANIPIINNVQ